MIRDFTLNKYEELCNALLINNYSTLTFSQYLEGRLACERYAILRHDIDRKPLNALRMAKLESKLGIVATYYFRYPYTFNADIINQIYSLGHEIGYHYEALSKARGDYEKAMNLFNDELSRFGSICKIETICMHGSPLSKYNNLDLWNTYDFRDCGILGEAYLSINKNITYFSDTGRSWNWENKLRDFLPGSEPVGCLEKTDDLIEFIFSKIVKQVYLLIHPERWSQSSGEWINNYIKDIAFNSGKKIIRVYRSP